MLTSSSHLQSIVAIAGMWEIWMQEEDILNRLVRARLLAEASGFVNTEAALASLIEEHTEHRERVITSQCVSDSARVLMPHA